MLKMRCSVPSCINDSKTVSKEDGITFHLFPKDENIRASWQQAVGLPEWQTQDRSAICSEHFKDQDFYFTKSGLKRFKSGALPVVDQIPAEDMDAPAVLRVCRICLAIDSKLYHIKESKLGHLVEQIIGLPIGHEDKLPQKLCWECAHRLLSCSRFINKAIRTQSILLDMLYATQNLTIRDIKSVNKHSNSLKSSLVTTIYDCNDYDMMVKDDQVIVKNEERFCDGNVDEELKAEVNDDVLVTSIIQVQIKDEEPSSEIFYEEFPDHFESDDDKTLSEMAEKCEKKQKREKKVKKKKMKMEKSVKPEKVRKKESKVQEEGEDPTTTMDKYKKSDVKRRKTQDGLDETLFTISTLSYEEQIAEIEKRQESTNYRTAPYKCTVCYRGFLIRDRYDAHVVRHSEASGAYECFICKTRLKTARALRKHLTAQHTEKFSCKGCPFVTRNRGVAREHEKWHAGTKYQCPHCPSEFDKLTTYMGHIRIKHVSDFVCELCGYTFVSKKGIDVHKKKKHRLDNKTVPDDGPYCEVCDVRFISEEAHSRHLKLSSRHSSDNDPNRIRNDSQSMNVERNGRVVRKIERRPVVHAHAHTRGNDADVNGQEHARPVTCEQCGIQLRDLRLYAQHFRRAHPDKNRTKYPAMKTPCMCEQCGRIFQSMALLKDHMWVHTGEKRFKCDRCDKSFTQKTNLVFHMRVHSNARPTYECPLCGKHFAFFNNRRRHMFIHTGLKPFKCATCGKCFTTSGEQRAHVDHVHLKKPWPKRARARAHWPHAAQDMED